MIGKPFRLQMQSIHSFTHTRMNVFVSFNGKYRSIFFFYTRTSYVVQVFTCNIIFFLPQRYRFYFIWPNIISYYDRAWYTSISPRQGPTHGQKRWASRKLLEPKAANFSCSLLSSRLFYLSLQLFYRCSSSSCSRLSIIYYPKMLFCLFHLRHYGSYYLPYCLLRHCWMAFTLH